MALAYVRHGERLRLAWGSGCDCVHDSSCEVGGSGARALRSSLQPYRGRTNLSACFRRHEHTLRGGSGTAYMRGCGQNRSCNSTCAVPAEFACAGEVFRGVLRHRSDGTSGQVPRRGCVESCGRFVASFSGCAHNFGDRRLWSDLFFVHRSAQSNGRRLGDGLARRTALAGHGVRTISPPRGFMERVVSSRRERVARVAFCAIVQESGS